MGMGMRMGMRLGFLGLGSGCDAGGRRRLMDR